MHVLIVDDEPMMADYLIESIGEHFPSYWIESAVSSAEAVSIASRMESLDLLVTDIMLGETDGFTLREALLGLFPNMQTVFVTGHDIGSFGDANIGKKILHKPLNYKEVMAAVTHVESVYEADRGNAFLPNSETEPRDGSPGLPVRPSAKRQRIETAVGNRQLEREEVVTSGQETALMDRQGFTGRLDQFQLVDIIQLCCLSGRTGRLTISKGLKSGVLFFLRNNIVHAVSGEMVGEEAAFEIISWHSGSFNFAEDMLPDEETIHRSWENLMMEGAVEGDEGGGTGDSGKKDSGFLGRSLGAYTVTRKLGAGEWGATYEARLTGGDALVALKVLDPEHALDPSSVQDFVANANTKMTASHPNMLAVPHGVATSDGAYFYPEEFVVGKTLADRRALGLPISEEEALNIIRVVAETVLFLNRRKIPHSGLRHSDIFLAEDGAVRLSNIAVYDGSSAGSAQAEIRELSKIVSLVLPGGVAKGVELRQLLARMLVMSTAGVPSWGALKQAVNMSSAIGPSAVPVAVAVARPTVLATPHGGMPKPRRSPAILYGSIAAILAVLAALLVHFVF